MSVLQAELKAMQNKNYFEILDASIDTPRSVLARARRKLLSQFHPDRHTGTEKEFAVKISSLINIAFEALSDDDFKKRYVKSGYTLRFGVTDTAPKRTNKAVTKALRGKNLFTILSLTGEQLFNGGSYNVIVQETNETHAVELPPNVQNNTHIVLRGFGEKNESGENGDLIVVISMNDPQGVPSSLTEGKSVVPIIPSSDLNKVTFYGSENLTEGEGFLYIKQSDTSAEGLIVDYTK